MLLVIRKTSEAAAMTQWGLRVAAAMAKPLHILWAESGAEQPIASELEWANYNAESFEEEEWSVITEVLAGAGKTEVKLCKTSCRSRHIVVLDLERVLSPSLIIVGRHDSARDGSMTGKLARELMDQAHSALLVFRLCSFETEDNTSPGILVPCAGGPHSRLGLKLASGMAGKDATAFYVEPDADLLSEEVGQANLSRSIQRAGLTTDNISTRVRLSSVISDAIADELHEHDYGLLLIGAASGGTLRRKLFGTVPERLMKGEGGVCVGVIRAARPVGHRVKEKVGRLLSLTIPQLDREERIQLFAEVEGRARWSFDFAVLMVLATLIAGLGLLADSAAVVIGAMLVAPLMTPLLGGGLAMVQGNWPLWKQCQKAVLLGFFSALIIGALLGGAARVIGMSMTGELMSRGEPTLLDLGVAFASGIAASYCLARPKLSSALAGVAIAAALVPPIATTGICLALGEHSTAKGAALLFGTNVVAIVLGSGLNFLIAGIRGKKSTTQIWANRIAIVLALACAGLSVPLASVLVSKASRTAPVAEQVEDTLSGTSYRLVSVRILRQSGQEKKLEIHLEGPDFPNEAMTQRLQNIVSRRYSDTLTMRIRVTLAKDTH
ncbi:MAG: DUF389 domain-containing protein [Akkermansiaceae bacterium]